MIWPKQGISFSVRVKRCLAFSRPARIPARCRRRMRYRIRHRCQRSRRLWGRNGVRSATPHIPVGKPPIRQIGVEFNMSSTRAREMRLILVNGEATVNHVDDRAREATFHILSGNRIYVRYNNIVSDSGHGFNRIRARCCMCVLARSICAVKAVFFNIKVNALLF